MKKQPTVEEVFAGEDWKERLKSLSFEEGLALLEELVEQVEAGGLPLERSILAYEQGIGLLTHLRELLSGAESKLELLQGNPGEKGAQKSKKK